MGTFAELQRAIEALPADEYCIVVGKKPRKPANVPRELAKLYATLGTLTIEVKPEVWPRPKPLDVLPAWRFGYGFRVFAPKGKKRAFVQRTGARCSAF